MGAKDFRSWKIYTLVDPKKIFFQALVLFTLFIPFWKIKSTKFDKFWQKMNKMVKKWKNQKKKVFFRLKQSKWPYSERGGFFLKRFAFFVQALEYHNCPIFTLFRRNFCKRWQKLSFLVFKKKKVFFWKFHRYCKNRSEADFL